ncbi:hypothetical protein EG351_17595 [Chryseobacterium bernardetii]|nr:hypothetical protein EG351_17595 [Chryseobacterium bernardetii]
MFFIKTINMENVKFSAIGKYTFLISFDMEKSLPVILFSFYWPIFPLQHYISWSFSTFINSTFQLYIL